MATQIQLDQVQQAPPSTEVQAGVVQAGEAQVGEVQPKTNPLEEVVVRVRRDSRTDSRQFLDETIVPEGGE